MFRRLINFLATVSLLLAFTAVVFWVRSYRHEEALCYGHPNDLDFYMLMSHRGLISWEKIEMPAALSVEYQKGLWGYSMPEGASANGGLPQYADGSVISYWGWIVAEGRRILATPNPQSARGGVLVPAKGYAVPFWTVSGLLFLLPIARFASAAQSRRRQMKGLCPKCGYDLRESPDRCPECGEPVA